MKADTYCKNDGLSLGFIVGGGHLGGGLNFLSLGELLRFCELEFSTSLFPRSWQICRVDGLFMTMAGDSFLSYPGRVDTDTLPATVFFWHTGKGTGTTVFL